MFMVQNELVAFYGYDYKDYPARKRDDVCFGGNLTTYFINLLRRDRRLKLLITPIHWQIPYTSTKTKLRGLSPRANYTDRAAAADRRS
jgi:hypothetical protein